MNLMSVKETIELIKEFKRIYPNDYKDIKLSNGGTFFIKHENGIEKYYKIGDLEIELQPFENEKDIEYKALRINGLIILNRFELLDMCNLNLHCPLETITV